MTSALHPDLEPEERRRLLHRGVELFNEARFYEAHEVWEEVWRSTTPEPRDLLQGLIQVAVAMVHQRDRGRPAVARRVLAKGRRRVEPYRPVRLGLDLEDLLGAVDQWSRWLESCAGDPPALPRLRLAQPAELR